MKLVAKFAVIFALLSMVSVGALGLFAYWGGRNMIIEDKNRDLLAAADYTQVSFERWIGECARTLELLSTRPFFKSEFEALIKSHDQFDPDHMQRHRKTISAHLHPVVEFGRFLEVFILRPEDGRVTFSTDNRQEEKIAADQPFFINGKKTTFVQNAYYSMALQQATMTIATPVKNQDGKMIAVLAGHLNLAELSRIMEKGRRFTRTQDNYLVNKFNFFVTEPRFGKNYALRKSVQTVGVNAALSGKDGIGLYTDYRNEPVIGAYRWIPEWELAIISEIDQGEAFAPIATLKWNIIEICVLIAALAAVGGWLTASTVTRPLKMLITDTERIGKGHLDFTASATGKDEVSELSRAFARMTRDLSETLVSREALAAEKAYTDTVINSLPGVFYLFDQEDLRFHRWNENFERVTEYSAGEIAKMSPLELFDETDAPRVAERIGQVFEAGYATVEAEFKSKSGRRIPHFFTGYALKIDGKSYLIGTGIDITEQKRTQEALRESEDRFRRLSENAKDMIYRMSLPDGRYEYVSPASEDIFGYPPAVFYENPLLVRQAIHPDWFDYFNNQWENLLKGEAPPIYEYQIVDAEGKIKWLHQRNVMVRNEEGQPEAIEGIVTDITEIKAVAQKQIRLEKFVVLGRVAAGVAHELNNPLMGVLNYAQYCRESTPKDDDRYPLLKDIEVEARRCIGIVRNLLGASRLEHAVEGKEREIGVEEILHRVVRLMEYRTGKENVEVAIEVEKNLPGIRINAEAFQQLCLNLFTNAVDAVEASEEKRIRLGLEKCPEGIRLTVSDTGSGIPKAVQDKIFDPFYTTKDPGKGTGLGLATCYKIVHQQGGTIEYHTRVGAGTTMKVLLPARPARSDAGPLPGATGPAQSKSNETFRRLSDEQAHSGH